MERDIIYLYGVKHLNKYLVPAETLVSLCILQYCQAICVNVVICENLSLSLDMECIYPIYEENLLFSIMCKKINECPTMVQQCILPAVLISDSNWCVVGIAASLRAVLKKSSQIYNDRHLEDLLGFRGGCLQAPVEVSVWTKFCEVEVFKTLSDGVKGKFLCNGFLHFPKNLVRYENHLSFPPILHNALKQKQLHIKNSVKDASLRKELMQKKLSELPELEHRYAEGLDLTLADIMLFASFYIIISLLKEVVNVSKVCPLFERWFNVVLELENSQRMLTLLNSIDVFVYKKNDVKDLIFPDINKESLYKSDYSRCNPHSRAFTHQSSINQLMDIIPSNLLEMCYDIQPDCDRVQINWNSYPEAVNPHEGQLPKSRLQRKCQQLENVTRVVLSLAKQNDTIVDFCSGGGHLGIIVAYLLPNCKVIFIENKETSLEKAADRIGSLGIKNVEFLKCNLDYFIGNFDIGMSLHACGLATDLVIKKCIDRNASFICTPCCYGAIQSNNILSYPRSLLFKGIPLTYDEYVILCHASDQTHGETDPKNEQGRLCMRLVDRDRLAQAAECGYNVFLYCMEPPECTPKNHLLIGKFLQ